MMHGSAAPASWFRDLEGFRARSLPSLGFRGATFAPLDLAPHFDTYHRSTCKVWWGAGAPAVVIPLLPPKQRNVCPSGSTPLNFSARGCTNVTFHSFMFV